MQGKRLSSILCTSTVDTVSKTCKIEPFKYRNKVEIPKLGFVDDIVDMHKCGHQTRLMNEYTTLEIGKRKLQFHEDKCHRLHIGKEKDCTKIFIDRWITNKEVTGNQIHLKDVYDKPIEIDTVKSNIYLGEVLSNDASIDENIKEKINKGRAIVKDIIYILENSCFGHFYFDAFKLLRESLFISVILNQSEVWYNVTEKELKKLEAVDAYLHAKVLESNSKTSHCLMHLELGTIPLRYIMMKKRIMYLHHLLTNKRNSLVQEVLKAQMEKPMKGDFINLCKQKT